MAYRRDDVARAQRDALEADLRATEAELHRFTNSLTNPEVVRCIKKLRRLQKMIDEYDTMSPRLLQ